MKKYYEINEQAARRAKEMNSFSEYVSGSATMEYRRLVDEATELVERKKGIVDSMYHEKLDYLLDTYSRRLAKNMNESFRIDASVPSVMISGPGNFPTKKKEQQNRARQKNWEEGNIIQNILEKIKSIRTGGISSDDPNATQKLEKKLVKLMKTQAMMKNVNVYYRKHNTLDDCSDLSEEQLEELKESMERFNLYQPYMPYTLSNNSAEIRRIKARIDELKKKKEMDFPEWEFENGKVIANKEMNRLQILFNGKPDEEVRTALKKNGFRWSPKASAWQRQLNQNAVYAARHIACIQPQ